MLVDALAFRVCCAGMSIAAANRRVAKQTRAGAAATHRAGQSNKPTAESILGREACSIAAGLRAPLDDASIAEAMPDGVWVLAGTPSWERAALFALNADTATGSPTASSSSSRNDITSDSRDTDVLARCVASLCMRSLFGHASQLAAARLGADPSLLTPGYAVALLRRALKELGAKGSEEAAEASAHLENEMNLE